MKDKLVVLKKQIEIYKKDANRYWVALQPREQQLLAGGGVILIILAIYWLISSASNIQDGLNASVLKLSKDSIAAISISKQYKEINSIAANNINQVRNDQVRDDVVSALENKTVDVMLQDGVLTINVGDAEFSKVTILLDQLRKSYGLFPATVNINRLSKSGHVAFNATFVVNQ